MKKENLTRLLLIIAAMGIGAFFYQRYHVPPAIDMPAIALTDLSGHKVSIQSFSGRPLFISFFATWCGPCIRELPELVNLKSQLADKELAVICISDEPIEKLQALQEKAGKELVILRAENSLHDIGIYTYPTNYIFDGQGKKVYDKVNPDHWSDPAMIAQIRKWVD